MTVLTKQNVCERTLTEISIKSIEFRLWLMSLSGAESSLNDSRNHISLCF
jgi:hypothetical protein